MKILNVIWQNLVILKRRVVDKLILFEKRIKKAKNDNLPKLKSKIQSVLSPKIKKLKHILKIEIYYVLDRLFEQINKLSLILVEKSSIIQDKYWLLLTTELDSE